MKRLKLLYFNRQDFLDQKWETKRVKSSLPYFLNNSNEFFIFELVLSHLLIIKVELKPHLLYIFERLGSIFKLDNKKCKVDIETEFEVKNRLELYTSNTIEEISQPDLVLCGPSLLKS